MEGTCEILDCLCDVMCICDSGFIFSVSEKSGDKIYSGIPNSSDADSYMCGSVNDSVEILFEPRTDDCRFKTTCHKHG